MVRRRVLIAILVALCSLGAASVGSAVVPPDPISPVTFDPVTLTTCQSGSFGGQATTTVNVPPVHVDKDILYGGAGNCKSITIPTLTAGASAKLYWLNTNTFEWNQVHGCAPLINQSGVAAAVCQYIDNSAPTGAYDAVFCITPNISNAQPTCAHAPFLVV